jgi:hypothetical protein
VRFDPWDPPHEIDHRYPTTVRLHGGSRHGQIVDVPERVHRQAVLFTLPKSDLSEFLNAPADPTLPWEPERYRRHKFVLYDDVEHALHAYDYWLADGEPLPKVGR